MESVEPSKLKVCAGVCVVVAALAALAYAPAHSLPFIADDYVHLAVARQFGPVSGWEEMARDPLYRFRAISSVLAYWTEALFGLSPLAFRLTSLFFHVLGTCLVAALGVWKPVGWKVSIPAAAFFAVAEGHQEAIIWYAAIPELQVFVCTLGAFLLWVRWLERSSAMWYALSLGTFALALLAKESGVCLIGLQVVAVLLLERAQRRHWLGILPFIALAAGYFLLIYSTRSSHQHFNDGTFSLAAPFWLTIGNSVGRMLWIWGFVAIGILSKLRGVAAMRFVGIAIAWAVITLGPYSFLTYMPRVPSRHTYLASVALALLAGAAFAAVRESSWKGARVAAAVLAIAMIGHNVGYLWTRKQQQYALRAAPTEDLLKLAKSSSGTIVVECFPYSRVIAQETVRLGAGQPLSRLRFDIAPDCNGGHRYRVEEDPQDRVAHATPITEQSAQ